MNDIQIFSSPEFGDIRTLDQNGEPWFVGKDVAQALGYSNPRDALAKHVDGQDRGVANCDTPSGEQQMTIINESGLYSLIFSSKLESAMRFKRWVTSEVLPAIRKTGSYTAKPLSRSELMAQALIAAHEELEHKTAQLEAMTPKAVFADAVRASKSSILIGELAKILRQNGVDIGPNRLFDWLRANGYLIRRNGTDRNMPTQRAVEMGLFEIKESTVVHSDGHTTINKTPKVTGKGQVYFVNLFLKRAIPAERLLN